MKKAVAVSLLSAVLLVGVGAGVATCVKANAETNQAEQTEQATRLSDADIMAFMKAPSFDGYQSYNCATQFTVSVMEGTYLMRYHNYGEMQVPSKGERRGAIDTSYAFADSNGVCIADYPYWRSVDITGDIFSMPLEVLHTEDDPMHSKYKAIGSFDCTHLGTEYEHETSHLHNFQVRIVGTIVSNGLSTEVNMEIKPSSNNTQDYTVGGNTFTVKVTPTTVSIRAKSELTITNGKTWFAFSCTDPMYKV